MLALVFLDRVSSIINNKERKILTAKQAFACQASSLCNVLQRSLNLLNLFIVTSFKKIRKKTLITLAFNDM